MLRVLRQFNTIFLDKSPVIHTYDEIINGREYHIEVSSVGPGQWRANIRRTPGGSAALMPFYGKTPEEAARLLSHWLSIAHGQTATRPSYDGGGRSDVPG